MTAAAGEMGRARGCGGPESMPSSFFSSPSSPSSSSSEFEFRVSLSPTSKRSSAQLCPADELFYKGQLLPLHLSPRLSMVRTLLLASSSTSSDSTATTASRDSNGSSSSSAASDLLLLLPDCDSSRPSSVTEDDARRAYSAPRRTGASGGAKYFSSFATRFSSVFLHRGSKKDPSFTSSAAAAAPSAKKPNPAGASSSSAKEVIKKYVKKVKPFYEKLSLLQPKHSSEETGGNRHQKKTFSFSIRREREASGSCILPAGSSFSKREDNHAAAAAGIYSHSHSHSFSGNLRYPRGKRCAGSCPSSMRSSPSHSGLLAVGGGFPGRTASSSSSSSMEELQSAIQGAIAHCKSSMIQNKASGLAPALVSDRRILDPS